MSDATRASPTGSETPTRAERLRQDQRARWERGERVPVESYLLQHPDLRGDVELLLDLIYQEVLLRLERGEPSRLEEYEFRFPELALQLHAAVVITDSGGIQEETTYRRVPCPTLRSNTERPVTITLGTNILVGSDSAKLKSELFKVLAGEAKAGSIPPLWDGRAGERIADILVNL